MPLLLYAVYDGRRHKRARGFVKAWAASRGLVENGTAWTRHDGADVAVRIWFSGLRSSHVAGLVVGAFTADRRRAARAGPAVTAS